MSISVNNLSFSYGENQVLKDVSFQFDYGDFVSVIGPNGAGKSTLFKCLLGINKLKGGSILIDGKDISEYGQRELAKRVAYIPQFHAPAFNYSVMDMVLMGTTAQLGYKSSPGTKQIKTAQSALEQLGIAHLRDRGFKNLSGGERQLVMIARAIAQKAKIMIMDEPTASLDFGNSVIVMKTMGKLAEDGYLIIQSTHDPNQAFMYSTKIIALSKGTVVKCATPREVVEDELISNLYDADIKVCSLNEDSVRVCVPADIVKQYTK